MWSHAGESGEFSEECDDENSVTLLLKVISGKLLEIIKSISDSLSSLL